jgi:hypothetical protein
MQGTHSQYTRSRGRNRSAKTVVPLASITTHLSAGSAVVTRSGRRGGGAHRQNVARAERVVGGSAAYGPVDCHYRGRAGRFGRGVF